MPQQHAFLRSRGSLPSSGHMRTVGDMQTVCNSIDFPLGYMRCGIPLWFGITVDKTNCEWITMLFTDYALLPRIRRA